MIFWFGAVIILAITKESVQTCAISEVSYYIQCENEVLSPNFHEKVAPLAEIRTVERLDINNTNSPEIATGAFKTLEGIRVVRINNAGVRVIQPEAFTGLRFLRKLYINNNKISEIQETYFVNLTRLIYLDLSYNNIKNIEVRSFNTLRSLSELILNNNFISKLSPNVFNGLHRLSTLDISFNKLTNMDDTLLKNWTYLRILYLNNNNFYQFDGSVLPTKSIKVLRLNDNNLRSVNNLSFPNTLSVLNVSNNKIQSLNFANYSSIQTIDLSFNSMSNIKNIVFKNLEVNELRLGQNLLGLGGFENETFSTLPLLEVISLSENKVQHLPLNLFKNNKKLLSLALVNNYLHNKDLPKLPVSLQALNFSLNKFDSDLNVTGLTNLLYLNVSFNNFTKVKINFLQGLNQLLDLDLSNNKIVKIDIGSFRDLKMLKALNLSNNLISVLEVGVFVGLNSLYRLEIAYNNLTVLSDGVFQNLRYLTRLQLDHNSLSYNSVKNALSHFYMLREVGLAGNGWTCTSLRNLLIDHRSMKLIDASHYDVTNIDGVSCTNEEVDSTEIIKVEHLVESVNAKMVTNNVVLILILVCLMLTVIVKYVLIYVRRENLNKKWWRREKKVEMQLINDC